MTNKDAFSGYHPFIGFLYFALVLFFSMFIMHPAYLAASLLSSLAYSIFLKGKKALRFSLLYMLPLLIITVLINPAVNHEGATILSYFPDGNPLTLESVIYGLAAAVMLISVLFWFSCMGEVITSDKFIYLFGRVIPALSLALSMALRFIPRFRAQLRVVSRAQRAIGRDPSSGSLIQRAKKGIAILSVMITWSLENAVDTADSMKSRGYGLKGRTAFSIYRFDKRDAAALCWLLVSGGYIIAGRLLKASYWSYFPFAGGAPADPLSVSAFAVYMTLCFTPLIINAWEGRKWTRLKSAT